MQAFMTECHVEHENILIEIFQEEDIFASTDFQSVAALSGRTSMDVANRQVMTY
jgi:hypothetical protein